MTLPPGLLARYAPLASVERCAPLVAHQATDVFALWRAWEEDSGRAQPVPFWAAVWPAARVLARWLLDHPESVIGARVLDLGCGGGLVAIAAAVAGASHVVANDVDPVALAVAQENAAANAVQIECSAQDLLTEPLAVPADLVLVADLFYEKEQAARTTAFLAALRGRGVRAIVADAGRPFAPRAEGTVLARERVTVDRDLEGVSERDATIVDVP